MDLALFDFDHTVTDRDTFSTFLKAQLPPRRLRWGGLLLAPLAFGYYRLKIVPARVLRAAVVRVGLAGLEHRGFAEAAERYAHDTLPGFIRPHALERIRWHQARGDTVVIVSASIDLYLRPWCRRQGVALICSQLGHRGGRFTGRYRGRDCCGKHKARRVLKRYRLQDFSAVHAYGDSAEDLAMLALARHRTYCWQSVQSTPD